MKSQSQNRTSEITIEIFADVICPWCYIGKRRLDAALAARPDVTAHVKWRGFLLNPSMPAEGMNRNAYLAAKFGQSAAAVYGRIAAAGLDSGIEFNFDAIRTTPDSRLAQLILLAAGPDSRELSEAIYKAYFINGLDIGKRAVLAQIATDLGRADLVTAFDDEALHRQLNSDLAHAQHLHLDGVPFFIFGGNFSIAGAHMPEHLIPAIDAALA